VYVCMCVSICTCKCGCVHVCVRNTLQRTATNCNTQHNTATHCNILFRAVEDKRRFDRCSQHAATRCSTLHHDEHAVTRCHTMQHTATRCNTLQHAATHNLARSKTSGFLVIGHTIILRSASILSSDETVLQCGVVWCSVLQCVAMIILSSTSVLSSEETVLQCVVVCCSVLQFAAVCCSDELK